MKKILYTLTTLLIVAFSTSCSNDDSSDDLTKGAYNYEGTMNILKNGVSTYMDSSSDVKARFEPESNTLTLILEEVKFDANMPMSLDITINNLTYTINNNVVIFSSESSIPTVAGKPYPQFTFTNLKGELSNRSLTYSANCMGYDVEYTGDTL